MIMFHCREQSRPEMGIRLLEQLADDVAELGRGNPRQDGRNMTMVLVRTSRSLTRSASGVRNANKPKKLPVKKLTSNTRN